MVWRIAGVAALGAVLGACTGGAGVLDLEVPTPIGAVKLHVEDGAAAIRRRGEAEGPKPSGSLSISPPPPQTRSTPL